MEGFEDTRRRVPSVDKAKRLLGFTPKVNLETGLKKTLAWCREHFTHRAAGGKDRARDSGTGEQGESP
jgi:hypothetical protein